MSDHVDQHGTIHLLGAPGSAACGRRPFGRLAPAMLCARSIASGASPNAPVFVVGTDRASDHAEACGLAVTAAIVPPLGSPRMARGALRRIAGVADRIICWSDELAPLAVGNAGEVELVSTRPEQCTRPPRRFHRITVFSDRDHALWSERGASPEQRELPPTRAPLPSARTVARTRLGITAPTIVLAALSEHPSDANAQGTAFLATVLQETGYEITVVLPQAAGNIVGARRHHQARGGRYRLIITDRSPVEWLPAADFVAVPHCTGSGADLSLTQLIETSGAEIIRLGTGGKATLASAQHAGGSFLDRLDVAAERAHATELAHA